MLAAMFRVWSMLLMARVPCTAPRNGPEERATASFIGVFDISAMVFRRIRRPPGHHYFSTSRHRAQRTEQAFDRGDVVGPPAPVRRRDRARLGNRGRWQRGG